MERLIQLKSKQSMGGSGKKIAPGEIIILDGLMLKQTLL